MKSDEYKVYLNNWILTIKLGNTAIVAMNRNGGKLPIGWYTMEVVKIEEKK